MKMKILAFCVALAMVLTVLTACGNKEPEVLPDLESPTNTATPSPTPTVKPSAAATPTATIPASETDLIELPPEDAPLDPNLAGSFEELGKNVDVIIRGEFTKKLDEVYNAIRSMDDGADPDPLYHYDQEQWEFKITEILKHDDKVDEFKVGDTIVINTDLTDLYSTGSTPKTNTNYIDMNLDEDTVLFLYRADFNPDHMVYQAETDLYCFTVEDGKLFVRSNDDKKIAEWNKTVGTSDGVPMSNVKKDIGIS